MTNTDSPSTAGAGNAPAETAFERKVREALERKAAELAAQPAGFVVPSEDIPDLGASSGGLSEYQQNVDTAVASITLQEVYQKLSKNRYANASARSRTKGESIMVSCPFPGHEDTNPSAWINADKGKGGVGNCSGCGDKGFDKFTVAGIAYGLDPKNDFPALNERMAAELRGVVRPADAPVVVVEPDDSAVDGQTGVPTPTGTPGLQQPTSDVPEADFPTYDLSKVLPGTHTFLDAYCEVALRADVPREFALWTGLTVLGMALGRKLALNKVGTGTYANLAVCLTAPSASGKSQSMSMAKRTLMMGLPYEEKNVRDGDPTPGVQVMALPGSGESLAEALDIKVRNSDGMVTDHLTVPTLVRIEELETLIVKAKDSAYSSFIIDFTDCQEEVTTRSKKNGHDRVVNGYVSFLTTTQTGRLRSQFSQRDKASGLLNRFIFPFGKSVAPRAMGAPNLDFGNAAVYLRLINSWVAGLTPNTGSEYWICESDWDKDAEECWIAQWNSRVVPDQMGPNSDFLGRMGQNMMRLILLFAANERSVRIRLSHVKAAFELYDYLRNCALMLGREVAATQMSDDMRAVMEAIELVEKGGFPATVKRMRDKSTAVKAMPEETLLFILEKLMRVKALFYVQSRSKTNKGRSGNCYTTDVGQWKSHATLNVVPAVK